MNNLDFYDEVVVEKPMDLVGLNNQLRFSVEQFLDFIQNKQIVNNSEINTYSFNIKSIMSKIDQTKEYNVRCRCNQ